MGCKAHLEVRERGNADAAGPPEWQVSSFFGRHNHELMTAEEINLHYAYCKLGEGDQARIRVLRDAGVKVRQIVAAIAIEKGVNVANLGFTERDVWNFLSRKGVKSSANEDRKANGINDLDAAELIRTLQLAKQHDYDFDFDYLIDDQRRLRSVFWCSGAAARSYREFGDTVVLDTTYMLNRYKMPVAPFIGVNNHGMSTMFGCGLLGDETKATFQWLLKVCTSLLFAQLA